MEITSICSYALLEVTGAKLKKNKTKRREIYVEQKKNN
jgi:hypothetical protein